MYDWNALWHQHAGYRSGFDLKTQQKPHAADVNALADELSARLLKPAQNEHDVAVYETEGKFILAGYSDGLQLLELKKHELFDITLHFITEGDDSECALPCIEVSVDNLATGENSHWRTPVSKNKAGDILVGREKLGSGIAPMMPFDELSFTDNGRFREDLHATWQHELPLLAPEIEAWFDPARVVHAATEAAATGASDTGTHAEMDARSHEMLERYAEIIRREQLLLSRRFADNELQLIAAVLQGIHFEGAAACRGLWLAVEARILDEDLDHEHKVDAEALLAKLKTLSYTQEVALIEALAPAR
ncbi:hypothetical protein [Craterilacuibacter sp.]|uniref:hypothetical protein n=1 Tax=Craterilacuibacter sp. TaxID=2870909 RepID=UPI003F338B0A